MKKSRIKDELILWMEVLPKTVKAIIKTCLFVLMFFILKSITNPIMVYYLPKDLNAVDIEQISAVYIIFLFVITVVVFLFFNRLLKKKE